MTDQELIEKNAELVLRQRTETTAEEKQMERLVEDQLRKVKGLVVTNEEADAAREHFARLRREARLAELRSVWNAPKRQLACQPEFDGAWGRIFSGLRARIGKGFTFALVGGYGCGKTQMGVELMRVVTEQLRSAYFVSAGEMFMEIKQSFDAGTTREIIRKFTRPSLLVIDEAGKRIGSDWENLTFFQIVNKRYEEMTDTFMTSNQDRQEFVTAIGPSLAERLKETGGIRDCDWASFRVVQ